MLGISGCYREAHASYTSQSGGWGGGPSTDTYIYYCYNLNTKLGLDFFEGGSCRGLIMQSCGYSIIRTRLKLYDCTQVKRSSRIHGHIHAYAWTNCIIILEKPSLI